MDIDYSKTNISNMARMFGVHRHTVRSKIEKAGIKSVDKHKGAPIYLVSEVAQAIYGNEVYNEDGEIDPEALSPSEQRDYWHAKQKKLDFLASIKTYTHQSEVTAEFAELAKRLKETIQSYPDIAETEQGASPQEVERLILLCDSLQEKIYVEFKD